jgi:hypothetical protein
MRVRHVRNPSLELNVVNSGDKLLRSGCRVRDVRSPIAGRGAVRGQFRAVAAVVALIACVAAAWLLSPWRASAGGDIQPVAMGGRLMTLPASGRQTLSVHASAGDTVIAYAWAPGSFAASGSVCLLASPSDEASVALATSSASGILCWLAPTGGTYYLQYADSPGASIDRGAFVSHAVVSLGTPTRLFVPYRGSVRLWGILTDSAYRYVAYDGPAIAFENVRLDSSRDGLSWTPMWAGATDVNGGIARTVGPVTRRTLFSFNYDGAVYTSAAFAATRSAAIEVIPRSNLWLRPRGDVRAHASFNVYGTLAPTVSPGVAGVVVEAQRRGSTRTLTFPMTAVPARGGSTPLRGIVRLPSRGPWSLRLRAFATSDNAETVTRWVRIGAR